MNHKFPLILFYFLFISKEREGMGMLRYMIYQCHFPHAMQYTY